MVLVMVFPSSFQQSRPLVAELVAIESPLAPVLLEVAGGSGGGGSGWPKNSP